LECFSIHSVVPHHFIELARVKCSSAGLRISSSPSFERLIAPRLTGHESFGDILTTARLGLLPLSQFFLGITDERAEFAEFRPTISQSPPAESGKADVRSFRHF
jgi:hypothetical protein